MAELFGFRIERPKKEREVYHHSLPPLLMTAQLILPVVVSLDKYLDQDGRERTEIDLIRRYRDIAQQPECDTAIEDIVNEGIISNEDDVAVQITLDRVTFFQKKSNVKLEKNLWKFYDFLHFESKGHDIFRTLVC